LAIDGTSLHGLTAIEPLLANKKPGDRIAVRINRHGVERTMDVILAADPSYRVAIDPNASAEAVKRRSDWLWVK